MFLNFGRLLGIYIITRTLNRFYVRKDRINPLSLRGLQLRLSLSWLENDNLVLQVLRGVASAVPESWLPTC